MNQIKHQFRESILKHEGSARLVSTGLILLDAAPLCTECSLISQIETLLEQNDDQHFLFSFACSFDQL